MSKFKVGDIVNVTDWGHCFSTYLRFFKRHSEFVNLASRYAFEDDSNYDIHRFNDNTQYKVIGVAEDGYTTICAIEFCDLMTSRKIYLVGEDGLCLLEEAKSTEEPREMTFEEIEEALGYSIKIVGKHE